MSTAPQLKPVRIQVIQQIKGTFLNYTRELDTTILMVLGSLASQQAQGTIDTANSIVHFLNYCATNPDAIVCYYASDMQLHIHSDASYFSELQV